MRVYHASKSLVGARGLFFERVIRAHGLNIESGCLFAHVSVVPFVRGLQCMGIHSNEAWVFMCDIADDTVLMKDPSDVGVHGGTWKVSVCDIVIQSIESIRYISDIELWEQGRLQPLPVRDLMRQPRPLKTCVM